MRSSFSLLPVVVIPIATREPALGEDHVDALRQVDFVQFINRSNCFFVVRRQFSMFATFLWFEEQSMLLGCSFHINV